MPMNTENRDIQKSNKLQKCYYYKVTLVLKLAEVLTLTNIH